jgi:hypothetical protein
MSEVWRSASGDCPREALCVVKLKDWNGVTHSDQPQTAVALGWSANAVMHGRFEQYSTPEQPRDGDYGFWPYQTSSFGPSFGLRPKIMTPQPTSAAPFRESNPGPFEPRNPVPQRLVVAPSSRHAHPVEPAQPFPTRHPRFARAGPRQHIRLRFLGLWDG